jgi:hypothetical protein
VLLLLDVEADVEVVQVSASSEASGRSLKNSDFFRLLKAAEQRRKNYEEETMRERDDVRRSYERRFATCVPRTS